jgi:hypothetical protein
MNKTPPPPAPEQQQPPSDQHPASHDYDSADDADSIAANDLREQDRLLPIANVGRIMKLAVPPAAKISKEAKESVQECVSEFITFVSSEYQVYLYLGILTGNKGGGEVPAGKEKDGERGGYCVGDGAARL